MLSRRRRADAQAPFPARRQQLGQGRASGDERARHLSTLNGPLADFGTLVTNILMGLTGLL